MSAEYADTCPTCPERAEAIATAEGIIAELRRENADLKDSVRDMTADLLCKSSQIVALKSYIADRSEPLVYIASAWHGADGDTDVFYNVAYAAEIWRRLADHGIHAICPQVMSERLDPGKQLGEAFWTAFTMNVERHCTHTLRTDLASHGADDEAADADSIGNVVFRSLQECIDTLGGAE